MRIPRSCYVCQSGLVLYVQYPPTIKQRLQGSQQAWRIARTVHQIQARELLPHGLALAAQHCMRHALSADSTCTPAQLQKGKRLQGSRNLVGRQALKQTGLFSEQNTNTA